EDGWMASGGQLLLVPVQVSGRSHSPAAARHTVPAFPAGCVHAVPLPSQTSTVQGLPPSVHVVPLALTPSAGQLALEPVQVSAVSHGPAAARQTVVDERKPSAGQLALEPVQVSAVSHGPAAARQTVVDGRKPSAGQLALEPVQVSAVSHGPAAARQTVVEGWKPLAGQVSLDPVQNSATSQLPADARHCVVLGRNWQVAEQHAPPSPGSQPSPASTTPFPHGAALYVTMAAAQGRAVPSAPSAA